MVAMNLFLRKVDHPNAPDNFRVILKIDDTDEYEIGSGGTKTFTTRDVTWTWGIDTVNPYAVS